MFTARAPVLLYVPRTCSEQKKDLRPHRAKVSRATARLPAGPGTTSWHPVLTSPPRRRGPATPP